MSDQATNTPFPCWICSNKGWYSSSRWNREQNEWTSKQTICPRCKKNSNTKDHGEVSE